MVQTPRLVAKMTMGDSDDSRALRRQANEFIVKMSPNKPVAYHQPHDPTHPRTG